MLRTIDAQVFGGNIADVQAGDGVLMVIHTNGTIRFYSWEHILAQVTSPPLVISRQEKPDSNLLSVFCPQKYTRIISFREVFLRCLFADQNLKLVNYDNIDDTY